MSIPLGFSDWDSNNNNIAKNNMNKENSTKRKTLKKLPDIKSLLNLKKKDNTEEHSENNTKIEPNNVSTLLSGDDEDESGLADYNSAFNPPPPPQLSKIAQATILKQKYDNNDNSISPQEYGSLDPVANDEYYRKNIPNYTGNLSTNSLLSGSGSGSGSGQVMMSGDGDMMQKLNYMIHLLEENKDEKTHNITEELILYCFMGVFVIFVLDNFVKMGGKYHR